MKKYFLVIVACLLSTSVAAENEAIYDPETGIVEIPELIILGQEGEYYIEMQRTEEEGFNFEVILAEKDADEIEDSDESRATYNPATDMVEIPLVVVYSETDEPLDTYTVKMLKKEGEGLFFSVTEAIKFDIKSSPELIKKIALKRMNKIQNSPL
jgi:hypothetical protein